MDDAQALLIAGEIGAAARIDEEKRFKRLSLAALIVGGDARAVGELLELYRRDRKWSDEAARKQLLKFFEALGPTNPLTVSGRKRLSSLMFA